MTPFNGPALLVMLQTFYPIVGPAALARARQERPDYFAGGVIIGKEGDALLLPDARVFDLIFNVNTPIQRWQLLEVTGGGPLGPDDPLRNVEGPLTPIDESAFVEPNPQPVFAPLVAAAHQELTPRDAAIGSSQFTLTEASTPGDLEATLSQTIDPAGPALDQELAQLDAAIPSDVIQAANTHPALIDASEHDLAETIPPPDPPYRPPPRPKFPEEPPPPPPPPAA